jgi:hypothetical protein
MAAHELVFEKAFWEVYIQVPRVWVQSTRMVFIGQQSGAIRG